MPLLPGKSISSVGTQAVLDNFTETFDQSLC